MISYIIVDDEPIAHEIIKGYCALLPNFNCVQHCYDALEAMAFLQKNRVDIVFLDLNMPKLKGFDFLKTLPVAPKVIVTTAYQEYALEGYALNVVDYLLKPFAFDRFLQAVNKAFTQPESAVATTEQYPSKASVFVKVNKNYVNILLENICYLESAGNYTKIVLEQETHTVRATISELLLQLHTAGLLQVHKSFVVAPNKITRIEGNQIFIGPMCIPIGKLYKAGVMQLVR